MTQATWGTAAAATLHCLTGCAIGEVLGMVIGTAAGLHDAATVVLSIALAFVFGYALTMRGVLRAGVGLRGALKIEPFSTWPGRQLPAEVNGSDTSGPRPG